MVEKGSGFSGRTGQIFKEYIHNQGHRHLANLPEFIMVMQRPKRKHLSRELLCVKSIPVPFPQQKCSHGLLSKDIFQETDSTHCLVYLRHRWCRCSVRV